MAALVTTVAEWLDYVSELPETAYLDDEFVTAGPASEPVDGNPLVPETFEFLRPTHLVHVHEGVLKDEGGSLGEVAGHFARWSSSRAERTVVLSVPPEAMQDVLVALRDIPGVGVRAESRASDLTLPAPG